MVHAERPDAHSQRAAWLLLLIIAAIPLGLIAMAINVDTRPEHSVKKHGGEAVAIHEHLRRCDPDEIWKTRSDKRPNIFYFGCELDDDCWGLCIVQKARQGLQEITSFVVKDGTRAQFVEYVSARATLVGSSLSSLFGLLPCLLFPFLGLLGLLRKR